MSLEYTVHSEGNTNSIDNLTGDNFTKEFFGSYFFAKIDTTTHGPV